MAVTAMTSAIGTADPEPMAPISGAAAPPMTNWEAPSSAAAVPAASP